MASLIEAIDIKRKMYFEFEGAPYHCLDVEVSKPTARGGQTLVRLKMRNLLTRAVFDKTFKAGEKFAEPDLSTSEASFLYADSDGFHFMDQENFETLTLGADVVGDDREFLTDNLVVQVNKLEGRPVRHPAAHDHRARGRLHGAGGARRHRERRGHQGGHARDRPRNPRAALHQGRREGEGPHRDPRVRRPGLGGRTGNVAAGLQTPLQRMSGGRGSSDPPGWRYAFLSAATYSDGVSTRMPYRRADKKCLRLSVTITVAPADRATSAIWAS